MIQLMKLTSEKCVYFHKLFVAYLKKRLVRFGEVSLQQALV